MTDPIRPALTPEEWQKLCGGPRQGWAVWASSDGLGTGFVTDDGEDGSGVYESHHRHAVAAFALYGQPFGFTWEDVDALQVCHCGSFEDARRVAFLKYRIAALLPPRGEQ